MLASNQVNLERYHNMSFLKRQEMFAQRHQKILQESDKRIWDEVTGKNTMQLDIRSNSQSSMSRNELLS